MPTAVPAPTSAPTQLPAQAAARPDAMGKDMFLKLLVAQMKYQDPMAPADGNAFVAQSSQLALVERLEELASSTAKVLAAEQSQAAAGLLHHHVAWTDEEGAEHTGVVTTIRFSTDGPQLVVGGDTFPLAAVTRVGGASPVVPPAPAAPPAATNPPEEG